MHPILSNRGRLLGYLLLWVTFGALIAGVIAVTGEATLRWAEIFAIPLAVVMGLQCLPCWYLVRGLAPADVPTWRLMGTWLGTGLVLLTLWLAVATLWLRVLKYANLNPNVDPGTLIPLLVFAGSVGVLIAILGLYSAAASERSRDAERRSLQLRTLAREAEMSFLRRQLDPHFLFNSLNSVAALIGSDAVAARRMCLLMADFFRKSLKFGAQQTIALADELTLIDTFLAIEEVRFGNRLRRGLDVSEEALTMLVPALLLQPLVENAVHHGIAHLLSGGEIKVSAKVRGSLLDIVVQNSCDPDRPISRSTGLGLANVRGRVESMYGTRARMDVENEPETFKVLLALPATPVEAPSARSDR
ncbi:MAG TPA: histidine kinase [Steroidobacteraceae bacterium]|nr:histidine kinase [Steroidobacteraceae bacterium]